MNDIASRALLDGKDLDAAIDRAELLARVGSWGPWGLRPLRLAATLI